MQHRVTTALVRPGHHQRIGADVPGHGYRGRTRRRTTIPASQRDVRAIRACLDRHTQASQSVGQVGMQSCQRLRQRVRRRDEQTAWPAFTVAEAQLERLERHPQRGAQGRQPAVRDAAHEMQGEVQPFGGDRFRAGAAQAGCSPGGKGPAQVCVGPQGDEETSRPGPDRAGLECPIGRLSRHDGGAPPSPAPPAPRRTWPRTGLRAPC